MTFIKNKNTRALILIMSALFLLGLLAAKIYYGNLNNSVDPRIIEARTLYEKYNIFAQENKIDSVLLLLDEIESIYGAQPHYMESYEVGVLYNNKAATYLTLALYSPLFSADSAAKDSLIYVAEVATNSSISIYTNWIDTFEDKTEVEIKNIIFDEFTIGLDNYSNKDTERFLKRRIKEIEDAQLETPRRLSVSYTNLGIICRHKGQYEDAVNNYTKALELWDQNLTAENNLNKLLNKPLKKRSFIQKLFPKERM